MNKKQVLIIGGGLLAVLVGLLVWGQGSIWDRVSEIETVRTAVPAEPVKTVELKDGDAYELVIDEVEKVIDGKIYPMIAYNGSIPGPVLKVSQGDRVTIKVRNNGVLGTTLHAHGVRMANALDGVPGVTQEEIAPGESFAYELSFPDAGAFWYHPHVRTDYALESGLYGSIIVEPKEAGYWAPANRGLSLMLDDIAIDKQGILPFNQKTATHTLMGRFGTVMLVNGETNYATTVTAGEVVRLYLTNAANTRLFNFTLPGARMKLVGADAGRYAEEMWTDEVLIAPGERRVVDVVFEQAGRFEMKHKTPGKVYPLGTVVVKEGVASPDYRTDFTALRTNSSVKQEMQALMDAALDRAPDKSVRLTLDMNAPMQSMMRDEGGHIGGGHMMGNGVMMSGDAMPMGSQGAKYEWEDTMAAMNATSTADMLQWQLVDTQTNRANMEIDDWRFALGDQVKIRIVNDPQSMHPMQHPIHFHGQNFLVLSTNGVKNGNPVWMDTALIANGDTVDILLDVSNPGRWMAHCHILEHAESGMMLMYEVK